MCARVLLIFASGLAAGTQKWRWERGTCCRKWLTLLRAGKIFEGGAEVGEGMMIDEPWSRTSVSKKILLPSTLSSHGEFTDVRRGGSG